MLAALAALASRAGGLQSLERYCSDRRNTDGPSYTAADRRLDIAIQEVQVALLLASIAMWMGLQHVVPRRCLVAHSSEGHQTPVGLQHVVPQRCFVATQRPLLSLRYVSAAQESRSISSAHLQGHSVLQILDMCTAMFLNYRLVVR